MENEVETRQLFKGALLLSMAGIISKILSAGYRIPLQNIAGDLGFYIYQQIYPVLGVALLLALYGFPAAVSKLVVELDRAGNGLSVSSFYLPVLLVLFAGNSAVFLSLYFGAEQIAGWMGDFHLAASLRAAAFVFLLVPFSSLFRGGFQGRNEMTPTAVSQVMEQVVRTVVILTAAAYFIGQKQEFYKIGTGAAFAAILAVAASSVYLGVMWRKTIPFSNRKTTIPWKTYIKTLFVYGLLISLNQMLLLCIQLADAFTLVPSLLEFGLSLEEARVWKGIFDRGQPLIQLGTVLGSSLALVLIPSITKKRLEKQEKFFQTDIHSAWKLSWLVSSAASVGLIVVFPYVNRLLFLNDSGTFSLQILAVAIFLVSLTITASSVLQGLGHIYATGVYVLAGLLCKVALNKLLVPLLGIPGSAAATVLSLMVVLLLNSFKLKRVAGEVKFFILPWKAWTFSLLVMVFFLMGMNEIAEVFLLLSSRLELLGYTLFVVPAGAFLYGTALLKLSGFTDRELLSFPCGDLLIQLSKGGNK